MGFLKQNINKIILIFFGGVFCFGIMKKILNPNFTKNKYFDQHFNGKVISNSYDTNTHFNIVQLSDYKKVYLEDLKIIVLIKNGDSLSKQKDTTYFTVFKKNNSQIIYDMYDKNLRVIK